MAKEIAEARGILLRWTFRLPAALGRLRQSLLALGNPGTGRVLGIGFAVMILLLLTLGTVFFMRLGSISAHYRTQTEITRPRAVATRELEIRVLSYPIYVRTFLDGSAEARQLAEADADEIAACLAEYERLAETPERRQLAADFSSQWSELRALGEKLLSGAQASPEDRNQLFATRKALRKLLHKEMQPDALAIEESQTNLTLSILAGSLRFNLLLFSSAVILALISSVVVARTVLNSQERVRKSEVFLRNVLNSSLNGVYIYDLELGSDVFINRQHTALLGFTLEDLRSMTNQDFAALWHPEDVPRIQQHIQQLKSAADGEVLEIDYRSKTADGRWIWCLSRHAVFMRNSNGSAKQIIGSFLDITARRQTEEALRQSEERLRLALEAASMVTWEWDIPTGTIRYSGNTSAVARGDAIEPYCSVDGLTQAVHPDDRAALTQGLQRTKSEDVSFENEHRVKMLDGVYRWISGRGDVVERRDGKPVRAMGISRDITERKEAEEALRGSERELKRVLETASIGLARCTRDFRWVWANAPLARLLGTPLEGMIGTRMVDVIGELNSEVIRPHLERALHGERVEQEVEMCFPGGTKCVYAIGTPDVDSNGQISGFFVSLTDMTRQKALEREVLESSEAEQRRLATNLHDGICQDLTAISATAKGLQRQLEKQEHPLAPLMGKISSSVAQATAQARQIAHGMDPVVTGGEGVIGALREVASRTAEHRGIRCSLTCGSPELDLEPGVSLQLFLIAREAVHNAAKHSGADHISVALGEAASGTRLAVADNGCGLPPGWESGSGLGLRTMRYRAGLIGAVLTVRAREGGGTEIVCLAPKRQGTREEKS